MTKAFSAILFVFVSFAFWACDKTKVLPDDPVVIPPDTTVVLPKYYHENTWIYQQMRINYLWADDMPDEKATDKSLSPVDYFNSLINVAKDRYSYATPHYQEILDYWNGNLESYGFRYKRLLDSAGYKAVVSLVLKGSPAEAAGMERGDILKSLDAVEFTADNTEELLHKGGGSFVLQTTKDSLKQFNVSKQRFQVDPLQYADILTWQGKKVGYLVYTQFLFNHEERTRALFQKFKDEKIDEMILDLRFNPGGVTPIAEVMASLLAPDLGSNVELFHGSVNRYLTEEAIRKGEPTDGRRNFTSETANLSHLQRIFVLTSKSSASSSELVINCLRPYREVITVGGNTYGKNVISTVLFDESGKFPYGLMPAWGTIVNARNESTYGNREGLLPDFPVEENTLPFRALGDTTETLLRAALDIIAPGMPVEPKVSTLRALDGFHHWDTGKGFLGNKRYNP
jgi:carboxyl-terminal processing protease